MIFYCFELERIHALFCKNKIGSARLENQGQGLDSFYSHTYQVGFYYPLPGADTLCLASVN